MKKGLKIIAIIISMLLVAGCLGVCIWYLYIANMGKEKIASTTYEVGFQTVTNEEGESTVKPFMEINYFANEDGSGLEMFEIRFNYMLDENQQAFYSQGLQYLTKSEDEGIEFEYIVDKTFAPVTTKIDINWPFPTEIFQDRMGAYRFNEDSTEIFNYASADDYEHTTLSTNPINNSSSFKIQLGDELFLMKFKNYEDTLRTKSNYVSRTKGPEETKIVYTDFYYFDNYHYYDLGYFTKLLYEMAKSTAVGTNSTMIFEFGDLFDYYAYNEESGQYNETAVNEEKQKLIENDIKSYYAIKVSTSASGAKYAKDSLFNSIKGNTGYNSTGDYIADDYFIGRSKLEVSEKDFDLVENTAGNFLKLKETFINYYKPYKDTIMLEIVINLDDFNLLEINIGGFAPDSGIENFTVYSCKFAETKDGVFNEWEVNYVWTII